MLEKWGQKEVTKLINFKSNNSMTCMHECTRNSAFDCLKILISKGMNPNYKDKFKRTPIFYAVINGSITMTDYLIRNGADPFHEDNSNNTLLHYAVGYNWKDIAVYLHSYIKLDINKKNNWNATAFSVSTIMKNPSTTFWILEQEDVNVSMLDDDGNNLVLILLKSFTLDEYSISEIRYLIERKGCQVDITNKDGDNALKLAINTTMPDILMQR